VTRRDVQSNPNLGTEMARAMEVKAAMEEMATETALRMCTK
jgi:hypothetical protein